jgi:hypothetical protein
MMFLGGVEVELQSVRRLATLVGRPLSDKLQRAITLRAEVIGLSRDEKKAVLAAVEKASEFAGLHQLLLANEQWRPVTGARS